MPTKLYLQCILNSNPLLFSYDAFPDNFKDDIYEDDFKIMITILNTNKLRCGYEYKSLKYTVCFCILFLIVTTITSWTNTKYSNIFTIIVWLVTLYNCILLYINYKSRKFVCNELRILLKAINVSFVQIHDYDISPICEIFNLYCDPDNLVIDI